MNVQKLRETVDLIENEAHARGNILDMGDWCFNSHTCGTVACLAGWAMTPEERAEYSAQRAARLHWDADRGLSVTINPEAIGWERFDLEEYQADKLFFTHYWPKSFENDYEDAEERDDVLGKVAILRERVEHFIATGE